MKLYNIYFIFYSIKESMSIPNKSIIVKINNAKKHTARADSPEVNY